MSIVQLMRADPIIREMFLRRPISVQSQDSIVEEDEEEEEGVIGDDRGMFRIESNVVDLLDSPREEKESVVKAVVD